MRASMSVGGIASLCFVGCGGTAVVDSPSGEGGTSTGSTNTITTTNTTTATTTTTTTATPLPECDSHDDCPSHLCIYSSGTCGTPCNMGEPCGVGFRCDECITSSCPDCYDCLGACVVANPGECDDHDDCTGDDVCVYWSQQCAPPCNAAGGCDDPNLFCDDCATAPCPFCAACMAACVETF